MHTKLVILFTLVCAVVSHDVSIGRSAGGRKIYDEIRQANPAIWRQIENVTIIAPSDEVISGVVVTDMRPDKDGDAQIVDGGEGKDRVTIELKSPTVLRGYEFHLEVYTVSSTKYSDGEENLSAPADELSPAPENKQSTNESDGSGDHSTSEMPAPEVPENSKRDAPSLISKDLNENIRPARRINEDADYDTTENLDESSNTTTELPKNTEQDVSNNEQDSSENISSSRDSNDNSENDPQINNFHDLISDNVATEDAEVASTTELPESSDNEAPVLVSEIIRPARETSDENDSEKTESADNVDVPSLVASDASTTESPNRDDTTTELNLKTTVEEEVTSAPVMLDNSKNIPDYPALDILDLIKEKEGTRRIRHTEDGNGEPAETDKDSATTELNTNNEYSEVSSESSVKSNDEDIIDLMPPEVDATYNTEFSDSEQSDLPKSDDDDNNSTTEPTTNVNNKNDENEQPSTTESSQEEQSRNARNAASTETDVDSNNVELPMEPEEKATCGSEIGNRNIIMLNGDALTGDGTQLRYEIPIVLVLANGNLPTIKIILEDNTSENKPNLNNLQPEMEIAENSGTNEEQSKNIESTDLIPPSDDVYVPKPVMIFEK